MTCSGSDFIWPFLRPYMGVIPNPKMAFIFPISCILALIFPILIIYFPKCVEKGSFPKSQIKSLSGTKGITISYLQSVASISVVHVRLSVCVVNMYCIRVQCIPLSVSVHLSVCVVCTVSLFVLYFRTPFLFTSVK